MKTKYRYFIEPTIKQAIQFVNGIGYWRHGTFKKEVPENCRSGLPISQFTTYPNNIEVKRKEFFKFVNSNP
jgi:hypothetical protein